MVERLLAFQIMDLVWCVDNHYSHEPMCVLKPDVEDSYVNRIDLPDTLTQ